MKNEAAAFERSLNAIAEHGRVRAIYDRILTIPSQVNPQKIEKDTRKYLARTHPSLRGLSIKQRRETYSFFVLPINRY